MNELTVWSESGHRFLSINEFAINKQGKIILLRDGAIFDVVGSGQEYTLCRGVGKTDIEGNKIYADSSIVEFSFKGFSETKTVMYKAVVEFDKFLGSYYFNVFSHTDHRGDNHKFYFFDVARHITSLKVIDTIQENKLGLYDAK